MENILIQDNDQDILDVMRLALELEGFNVYSLLRYKDDFLEYIDLVKPHVVIIDYRLSGAECIDICQKIKQRHPHLPVIACSCNTDIHTVYDQHGFNDYIKKPFDIDLLYKILRKHIRSSNSASWVGTSSKA